MKRYLSILSAAFLSLGHQAVAADTDPIRIGVLNDSSGLYADLSGEGSAIASTLIK